jgi:lysyl oxidase/fibronectin type III domain protein
MFRVFRFGPALVSFLMAFGLVFAGAGTGVAVAQVLPDLTMLQPTEFHLDLPGGGVRRLRFSTSIVNIGPGRFDVVGSDPDPTDATKLTRVTQRLEQGGGWVLQPTPATMFYSGDGHNHWHVFGLQDFKLAFQATPNDRIATGVKTGFCFWDNVNLSNAPRFYTGATECHQQTDGTVPMGLSVNWGDKYPWNIAFQYIDISQLPNGNYCLTITADPRGEFIEASNANNSVQTLIDIQPGGVTVLAANCAATPTPPATPTGLTATARDRAVDLNWNDNTDTVTGYKVYRDANAGVSTTASAYTDTGLTNGTNYCYRVTAVNGSGGESSPSAQACATPAAPPRVVHIADLDRIAKGKGRSGKWEASVTVTVRDAANGLVAGATVTGNWSGAISRSASGVTASNGSVTLATGQISGGANVTFTVTNVTGTGLTYNPAANGDTDGDSNGTAITIARP